MNESIDEEDTQKADIWYGRSFCQQKLIFNVFTVDFYQKFK